MQPPHAAKLAHQIEIHGDAIVDDYFWLRDRDNPQVMEYLKAENDYTEQVLQPHAELRESLFQELKAQVKEDDLSVPVKKDDYYYYSRVAAGKQYAIHCRKRGDLNSPEEIILDENQLAEGKPYFQLGTFSISPNHQLLAYAEDIDGSETYTLRIKNLATGELLPESIANTYYSLEWVNDNQTFYYTVLDDNLRPYRLYRHTIGQPIEGDELIYEEQDSQFFVGCDKSRDDRYIFLTTGGKITSEQYFISADEPHGTFSIVTPRQKGHEYSVSHHEGFFYILTNDNAQNFRIMRTLVSQPQQQYWVEYIAHDPDRLIEGIDEFKDYLIISERYQGLGQLRAIELQSQASHYLEFDDPTYLVFGAANWEYDTQKFRFGYTSLVSPMTVFEYDLRSLGVGSAESRSKTILKQNEIPGGYDPNQYHSERIFARSHDGVEVPISIVYRRDFKRDGTQPLYLYGYGSYGASIDPGFSTNRLSLLDRGFVYAIAHIRGGSELGRYWYESGKFLRKKNTFLDFVACAEHLIAEKYTSAGNIAIAGGSAGGLLVGATINLKPELFKAAIAQVPFVDVLNTMLDADLPLTQLEYDEWGNPADEEFYRYIRSYSPYDNVEAKAYPHLLITAGLNDPRVTYWEPAKWTAKLRSLKTDNNLLLLKTNLDSGHGGASGRYEYLKDIALEYTFLLTVFEKVSNV
ncbi:S9 family peptidase [Chamaesiphon sp. VAR_69_metabat_338]|uniref:S9 family peptidase n=1 Tax=Chamaesiphon sp. VAR_69_metabat_338 TaxID=2964704 RepID=UPI00286D8679|nr:S9 family peptidase [Chamaesiphon sp. VAR_69_metabat_338]